MIMKFKKVEIIFRIEHEKVHQVIDLVVINKKKDELFLKLVLSHFDQRNTTVIFPLIRQNPVLKRLSLLRTSPLKTSI